MAIVSSSIVEDRQQVDGRRAIRERHTDHAGAIHEFAYLASAGDDVSAVMASRVASIESGLASAEIDRNIVRALDQQSVTTVHCTVAQLRTALREFYKVARGWDVVRMGRFIRFVLNLTDNQLKSVFGVNDAQLVPLKARLDAQVQRYNDVIADAGE